VIQRIDVAQQRAQHRVTRQRRHEALLRWLLDFIQREPQQTRDRAGLERFDSVIGLDVFPARFLTDVRRRQRLRLLSGVEIVRIHRRLRTLLGALKPVDRVTAESYEPLPEARLRIRSDGHRVSMLHIADWPDTVLLSVASLLTRFGERVIRCDDPTCRRLFLRTRRGRFCSPQCSQRVRSRAFYVEHSERLREKRREAYRAQVTKLYPLAKIGVRKRKVHHAKTTRTR
jgi:hypothetical protein